MIPLWVFGYGSLMWRPGFPFEEVRPAHVVGLHRALCIYSVVHRGTPEAPGLVFGLDRGGDCAGLAFRIADANADDVLAYLGEREQVTGVYRKAIVTAHLAPPPEPDGSPAHGPHEHVRAVCYLVDRTHQQYAGDLHIERQARIVRVASGGSGPNLDYVMSTARHVAEMGIIDRKLARLISILHRAPGQIVGKGEDEPVSRWAHRMRHDRNSLHLPCMPKTDHAKASYRRRLGL